MKAQTPVCTARPRELGLKQDLFSRVSKSKVDENEMAACIDKLKDLVPTIPQDKKISKIQLLQHVIDYILDLETTLEFNPSMRNALFSSTLAVTERKPLVESSQVNTQMNQASHIEKVESSESSRMATC